jgi:integrin alpha 8
MKSQQDGEPARPDLEVGVTHLEKMAQGQGGFQVGTFELPQVQRNNVDEDLRHRSEQTWAANAGGASRQSGGSASRSSSGGSWQTSSGQQSSGTRAAGGSGTVGGGGGGSYTYSSSTDGGQTGGQTSGRTGGHRTSWSSSSGGNTGAHTNQQVSYDDDEDYSFDEYDNIEDEYSSHNVEDTNKQHGGKKHDKTDDKFKHYQRFRRQAYYEQDDDADADLKKALQCSASRCAILRCVAGPLLHQREAWIAMRTRLVASTMQKVSANVPLTTSTMTVARINKLPYIGTPKERPIRTHELLVKATPEPVAAPDVVPLWVVVLAACAGTIILLLLIYLLYKVSSAIRPEVALRSLK